jgi:hypothetical protein
MVKKKRKVISQFKWGEATASASYTDAVSVHLPASIFMRTFL